MQVVQPEIPGIIFSLLLPWSLNASCNKTCDVWVCGQGLNTTTPDLGEMDLGDVQKGSQFKCIEDTTEIQRENKLKTQYLFFKKGYIKGIELDYLFMEADCDLPAFTSRLHFTTFY